MEDDLNTADAIASLFEIVNITNTNFNEKTSKIVIQYTYDNLVNLSKILGIYLKKKNFRRRNIKIN